MKLPLRIALHLLCGLVLTAGLVALPGPMAGAPLQPDRPAARYDQAPAEANSTLDVAKVLKRYCVPEREPDPVASPALPSRDDA